MCNRTLCTFFDFWMQNEKLYADLHYHFYNQEIQKIKNCRKRRINVSLKKVVAFLPVRLMPLIVIASKSDYEF